MKNDSTTNAILNFSAPFTYDKLMEYITALTERYPALVSGYIGTTILNKAIPILTLGNPHASKSVFYITGIGAGDSVLSAVLLRFVNDYYEYLKGGRRLYSVNLPYLAEHRQIFVLPMLNCDGCTIRLSGCGENILKERLLSMNGGKSDFSQWESNARGVDLRHNFSSGFQFHSPKSGGSPSGYSGTSPESEPETASLCSYLRMHNGSDLLLTLHMDQPAGMGGKDTPAVTPSQGLPRSRTLGRLISRMSGAPLQAAPEASGTIQDWYGREMEKPAFSLGCRYSGLENQPDDYMKIYAYLRELLFSVPLLV